MVQYLPSPQRAAGGPQRPPAGSAPLGPKDVVEGGQVEYYSDSYRCWVPCTVTDVDPETGALRLDVKPNQLFDLVEQRAKLRPRTRPLRAHLEWVRRTLREGRLEEEAQVVFRKHAAGSAAADGAPPELGPEGLHSAGEELDGLLGVSGSVCALKKAAKHASRGGLAAEGFVEVFWELLWRVQRDFGQALLHEAASQRCHKRIQQAYELGRTLGMGTFGTVKLARSLATGAERAVKVISKSDHQGGSAAQVQVEVEHLCSLDHPHIVKLYEHYEDPSNIYLVMDFCSGGELHAVVREHKEACRSIPEAFVADVMRQVMLAIAHVHARGIVHLDLKSTNIMLMPSKSTLPPGGQGPCCAAANVHERPHAMIIDLGVAQLFRPGNFKFNRPMGTPATMAPEVWHGEIHPKADVFSCGVVLFELLALDFPFHCGTDHAGALRFWASRPAAPWHLLQAASQPATELCRWMLALERRGRLSASGCLRAAFLREPGRTANCTNPAGVPQRLVRQLARACKRSVLHRSVALSLAREWPPNQLPSIKRFFHELDIARSGRLSYEQLEVGLKRLGMHRASAQEAAEAMDLSRDGTVCWTEFVAACIDLGSSACESSLRRLFDGADGDHDGLLSEQDLRRLLAAEHLRDENAAHDVFAELAGRTDPGARVDWPTFRRHFQAEGAGSGGSQAGEVPPQADAGGSPEPNKGSLDLFEQALGFVERAREAFWPEPRNRPSAPDEAELQELAAMGFTDREKCIAVLQRHQNRLSVFVVNELVESSAGFVVSEKMSF